MEEIFLEDGSGNMALQTLRDQIFVIAFFSDNSRRVSGGQPRIARLNSTISSIILDLLQIPECRH
jgi:hypothetical protein